MCERDFLPGRTFYLFIFFHLDSDFLVIAWVVPKQTQATSEKKKYRVLFRWAWWQIGLCLMLRCLIGRLGCAYTVFYIEYDSL